MNTIGKILVILNFLFAVIVAILMVVVAGMRAPLREQNKELESQARVLAAQRDAYEKSYRGMQNDARSAKVKEDSAIAELNDQIDKFRVERTQKDLELAGYKAQREQDQQSLNQAVVTIKNLTAETAALNKTITERENLVVKLEADVKKISVQAQNYEGLATARQIQNENLLELLREHTRRIALLESGVNPDVMAIRDPNAPNPPAVQVDGRIEKVDERDNTLIQISLGTDHGVNKNHTLDVFRIRPQPQYLGMIRILEAYHQRSVAQLVTTGSAANRPQLRVDDQVTSKLSR